MPWFSVSLLVSFLIWFYFIYKHDKIKKEPLHSLLLIAIVGGSLSATLAGFLNTFVASLLNVSGIFDGIQYNRTNSVIFMIFVGLNEEFFKFLATVLLIKKLKAFDEPIDGIIYSMTLALGFATIENIGYMTRFGTEIIIFRSISAVPLHLGCAAILGIGIVKTKFSVSNKKYFTNSIPYILIAATIHTIYNSSCYFIEPGYALLISMSIAFGLIWMAHKSMRTYLKKSPWIPAGFCRNCGNLNSSTTLFCSKCKYPLN